MGHGHLRDFYVEASVLVEKSDISFVPKVKHSYRTGVVRNRFGRWIGRETDYIHHLVKLVEYSVDEPPKLSFFAVFSRFELENVDRTIRLAAVAWLGRFAGILPVKLCYPRLTLYFQHSWLEIFSTVQTFVERHLQNALTFFKRNQGRPNPKVLAQNARAELISFRRSLPVNLAKQKHLVNVVALKILKEDPEILDVVGVHIFGSGEKIVFHPVEINPEPSVDPSCEMVAG